MRALALLLLAGCAEILGIKDLPPDGATTDGPPSMICQAVGARCDGDVLRQCTHTGEPDVTAQCALGCLTDGGAHCGVLVPSADGATTADTVADVRLQDLATPPNITTTLNSSTGAIEGLRAPGTGVIEGIEFEVNNSVGVFRVRGLAIGDNSTLRVIGNNAVALVATERDVGIGANATIDARGLCAQNQGGPGGFLGGVAAAAGQGLGGGDAGAGGTADASGGGGGGHGARGGKGGDGGSGLVVTGGLGGAQNGTDEITRLVGGAGGGGGGNAKGAGIGGGGGGAIQVISNTAIRLANNGAINAGGCGGGAAKPAGGGGGGGGGGGAGGTILLEAPIVELADLSALAVNGGGGGGSTGGIDGNDGDTRGDGALGGSSTDGGIGGTGGATNSGAGGGDGLSANQTGGGGGGGGGRIRLNTKAPPSFSVTSIISPKTLVSNGVLVVQ